MYDGELCVATDHLVHLFLCLANLNVQFSVMCSTTWLLQIVLICHQDNKHYLSY